MRHEVTRIENWSGGDWNCVRCGRLLTLHFNGGELDATDCCGLRYITEHVQIDLVVYDDTKDKKQS